MRTSLRPSSRLALGAVLALSLSAGAVLSAPLAASADTVPAKHFVNCAAKTGGDGLTEATAWNNLAAVYSHGGFIADDQILLKRGTTCKGQLYPTGSGIKDHPIVISSYGSGAKPTVAGGGTYNNTGAVQIVNQRYWIIQNLHVTNATPSANPKTYRTGILLQNDNGGHLAGLIVRNNAVDSVRSNPGNGNTRMYGGISALTFGTLKSGFDGLQIYGNTVKGVSRTGIITSNTQYPRSSDTGTRIAGNHLSAIRGDGIVMIGAKSSRIDTNVVVGAGDLGSCSHCGRMGGPSTASAGIWPSNTSKVRIDHNEVARTRNTGGDGEAFDIDRSSVDTVLEYNYAHDNAGGGVLLTGATNSTIRFNILENNGQGALTFYGKAPSTKTSFYNNTVYISRQAGAKVVRTFGAIRGSKVSFRNNIVYSYGPGTYQWPTRSVTTSSNTLLGNHGFGRPGDRATSYAVPGLKNPGTGGNGFASLKGYKPSRPSSFLKGAAVPSSVKTDFFGKRINAKKPPRGAAG
jgi:parallel beta-helix repeat protein